MRGEGGEKQGKENPAHGAAGGGSRKVSACFVEGLGPNLREVDETYFRARIEKM